MKTSELLERAKALIEDEAHWTKGTYARAADGKSMEYCNPDACSFCAEGAIRHVAFTDKTDSIVDSKYWEAEGFLDDEAERMLRERGHMSGSCAITFNDRDDTTHALVLELYDRAILRAREAEAAQR